MEVSRPDLAFLKDERLNSNPTFHELRQVLESYYYRESRTVRPEKSPKWNSLLYASLLAGLRQVSFSSDPQEREDLLDDVYRWYQKKLDAPRAESSSKAKSVSPNDLTYFLPVDLKRPAVIKPIEGRSVSPERRSWVRATDVSLPQVHTASSLTSANLLQRFHDYQSRKTREQRSLIQSRRTAAWSCEKPRVEEDFTFLTEPAAKAESRSGSPMLATESTDWLKRTGGIGHSPVLVDLRSDYSNTKTQTTVTTESAADRVAEFRQKHADAESPLRLIGHSPMSIYRSPHDSICIDVQRPTTPSHTPIIQKSDFRPVQPSSLSPLRRSRIQEIDEVKRRLAQHNLPCTFRVLKEGLMEPEALPASMLTPQSLPQGGELLQSNPFFVARKKKKKLKRKK